MKWLGLLSLLIVLVGGDYVREFSGPSTNRIRSREKDQTTINSPPQQQQDERIPLELFERLDGITDPYTFLTQFVEDGQNFTSPAVEANPLPVFEEAPEIPMTHVDDTESRNSDRRVVEADGGPQFAIPAGCKPQPTVIPLYDEYNPRLIVYPKCTIVEQCQGCCNLASHSCQPKKKEPVFVRVIKAMYIGSARKLTYLGKFTVQVEKHNECECSCRVKPTDCNMWQKHDPYTCKCECKDEEDRRNCLRDMENRVWEDTSCTCRCRHERPCSSGLYFDHDECNCKPLMGMPDGQPRVFPAGRHGFNPVNETAARVTLAPMHALPLQSIPNVTLPPLYAHSVQRLQPSTTTTTPSTTTSTIPTTRRKDADFYRRLRRMRNRQRQRTTSNRNNML